MIRAGYGQFLSTFPLRGTSESSAGKCQLRAYFYPRSPCGERHLAAVAAHKRSAISIHVPLAGNVCVALVVGIRHTIFLSTFPLRGTSAHGPSWPIYYAYFYPRSPCGERHLLLDERITHGKFLSTFPLRGTSYIRLKLSYSITFLSTFPLRGTSCAARSAIAARTRYFYPRSPCGERLISYLVKPLPLLNFYPRSPCGERLAPPSGSVTAGTVFLSTFPLRGTSRRKSSIISILLTFLSTFPLRGTSGVCSLCSGVHRISIHVPLAGNVSRRR